MDSIPAIRDIAKKATLSRNLPDESWTMSATGVPYEYRNHPVLHGSTRKGCTHTWKNAQNFACFCEITGIVPIPRGWDGTKQGFSADQIVVRAVDVGALFKIVPLVCAHSRVIIVNNGSTTHALVANIIRNFTDKSWVPWWEVVLVGSSYTDPEVSPTYSPLFRVTARCRSCGKRLPINSRTGVSDGHGCQN